MQITITETCDGPNRSVTIAELNALEQRLMSILTEPLVTLNTSVEGVKTRVTALEASAVGPEEVAAVIAVAAELDKIAVPPVEEPPVEVPPTV